jgi:hypothetical protein
VRVQQTESWPEGIFGSSGQIPFVVQDGNLVPVSDPDAFTLTNSVKLHPNSRQRYGLQYFVQSSYSDAFPRDMTESVSTALASQEEFLAREEASTQLEEVARRLRKEAKPRAESSRRSGSAAGFLSDAFGRDFLLVLGLVFLITTIIFTWAVVIRARRRTDRVRNSRNVAN